MIQVVEPVPIELLSKEHAEFGLAPELTGMALRQANLLLLITTIYIPVWSL